MTYLVTEGCVNCKHSDCVVVCPVDCFHEGPNFISIDPDECIDCGVCVPECPVDAIVADNDTTVDVTYWLEINRRTAKSWPVITIKKDPLPDHEMWNTVLDKKNLLKE